MSSLVNQTHGHLNSFPVEPHMPLIKNTPRLQCTIPDSPLQPTPFESSADTSMSAIVDMDDGSMAFIAGDWNQSNLDRIALLERTVCTNFYCCSTQHADFHALLVHYESHHVFELTPDGKRFFPIALDPSSGESTPASSRASSISPSGPSSPITPPYSIPPSPSLLPPAISFLNRKSDPTMSPVYTPFTPCYPIDPSSSIIEQSEIVVVQETNYDFSTSPSLLPPLELDAAESPPESVLGDDEAMADGDDDEDSSPAPEQPLAAEKPDASLRIPKAVRASTKGKRNATKSEVLSKPTTSKPSKSRRGAASNSLHSRRRERMYHCDKPGCVKTYLNPNGLKYHQEKGTCKFEDEDMQLIGQADPSTESSTYADSGLESDPSPSIISRRPSPVSESDEQVIPSLPQPHRESDFTSHQGSSQVSSIVSTPNSIGRNVPPRTDLVPQPSLGYAHVANKPQQRHQVVASMHGSQQSSLGTDPHACRTTAQSSVTSRTFAQPMAYHYPVPSYPQGYAIPQHHRPSYHEGGSHPNLHAPLMGGLGSASSASSQ